MIATNGADGLKKVESEKPDLILLDIRMPDMDGLTMLSILRKKQGGSKARVIMLTNLEPDNKIIDKVLTDQPSYYFIKSDIKFSDLLTKVKELLAD